MKIVNAYWEKRNIGMDAVEITLEPTDFLDIDELITYLKSHHLEQYTVIKSPVGNLEILHRLQDIGCYFMETQFILEKEISDYIPPKSLMAYKDSSRTAEVPKAKWKGVVDKITYLYQTDRIYLDPLLDVNASDTRYRNWIDDLSQNNNSIMYATTLPQKKTPIGYGIGIKHDAENLFYSLLTGIYPAFQGKGLGGLVIHGPICLAKQLGYNRFKTAISSNNIKVVKKHLPFGFELSDELYVLRRHPENIPGHTTEVR